MPYWKVTTDLGDSGGTSVVVESLAKVVYSKNEYVSAPQWLAEKGYHLTVFTSLFAARNFKSPEDVLWECEVVGLKDELPPSMSPYWVSQGCVSARYVSSYWPRDTAMAEQVMLTRRIE